MVQTAPGLRVESSTRVLKILLIDSKIKPQKTNSTELSGCAIFSPQLFYLLMAPVDMKLAGQTVLLSSVLFFCELCTTEG